MKEEGIFTEGEIGEVLELKEKQIRKRLRRMKKELEDLFGLRRRNCDKDEKEECCKRVTKNPEKRKLGEEFMARWRDAKQAAHSVVPTPHFLLLPMTETGQPQFRPTSMLTADRAWHLRHFVIAPNPRITVRTTILPLLLGPNRVSRVI